MSFIIKYGKILLLIVSIIVVISYILTDHISELFTDADKWYNLASQIGVAYIASFIFYIMINWIPEKENKRKAYRYIDYQLNKIITFHDSLIEKIIDNTKPFRTAIGDGDKDFDINALSKSDIKYLLQFIGPNQTTGNYLGLLAIYSQKEANWSQYITNVISENKKSIEKIVKNIIYIDTELLEILHNLEMCQLFNFQENLLNDLAKVEKSLGFQLIEEPLYEYYKVVKQLKEYRN